MNLEKNAAEVASKLSFTVEDKNYVTSQQFLFGWEIKKIAGIPLDAKLFMQNRTPWVDNLIEDDEEVDLARPGIEYFFVGKDFELKINGAIFQWHQRYIMGKQVLELGKLDEQEVLYLKTSDSRIDQLIGDDDKVDLLEPGIEQFYTKEVAHTITLIISGVPKSWNKKKISFKEVIILAYDSYDNRSTMVYTVAYEDGPKQNPEGSMVKGTEVFTKDHMIFHATATDKS